jgi:hypothetical protein
MRGKYYAVAWAGNVRFAGPLLGVREACKDAYGIVTSNMVVVEMPKNPKYMSATLKQEIYQQIRDKEEEIGDERVFGHNPIILTIQPKQEKEG